MEEKSNNIRPLNPDEMSQAAGGCWFYHSFHRVGSDQVKNSEGHITTYEYYRCPDCGAEQFQKDGKLISPSQYYGELYNIHLSR